MTPPFLLAWRDSRSQEDNILPGSNDIRFELFGRQIEYHTRPAPGETGVITFMFSGIA